jgi:predicted acylesterase/phospholipase RssA
MPPVDVKKFDVLLSYSRRDRALVEALAQQLQAASVRVWFDLWELTPGQEWRGAVAEALSKSKAFAVCVGSSALDSYMEEELRLAEVAEVKCFPIMLPGSGDIPASLMHLQAIDLRGREDKALLESLQLLIRQLGGKEAPPPPPPAPVVPQRSKPPQRRGGETPEVAEASSILRGRTMDLERVMELVRALKAQKEFGIARRLLARARADYTLKPDAKLRLRLGQQHALCTYKDPHLSVDEKFDRALRILNEADDLLTTHDQETLGLAGAICKYKWESLGQKVDLERAATYYLRGYEVGPKLDFGYTGINAAYVLDVLASQEQESAYVAGATSRVAEERRENAKEIRETLVGVLPPVVESDPHLAGQWWFLVTVAEGYFGLERYEDARQWLERARAAGAEDWEFESTARQLANLARVQAGAKWQSDGAERLPAWQTLVAFLGPGNAAGVRSAFLGRVGLALSGGGFRASLFHIGVLARLAELDVLRHVEVLSCVSGGSIVGAHYYLEVRNLLQTKKDGEISREDYIAIVRRMEEDFLKGVQRNIRTRVAASLLTNLKMMFLPNYSRTEHAGALFEREIFAKVLDGGGGKPRYLDELTIQPAGEEPGFRPADHNWRRASKVPVLVLNATTLNTGHNWQFTATYMGEPPSSINAEVDGNCRLRRMYYREAPPKYQKFRLGNAVGASACVPGLFEPINLPALYEHLDGKDTIVRLVDGGVYDNQGISALLEQGCQSLLVSDASGQMGVQNNPGPGVFTTLLRSNSVLQSRVRVAEYQDLNARRRSSLVRNLMFIHLKKDLESDPVNWIGCEDPVEGSDEARPAYRSGRLTSYGIRKDVQQRLAAIRTDLDSFHDIEAFALMTSGYRMTEYAFAQNVHGFPKVQRISPGWQFLTVEPPMKRVGGPDSARLMKLLNVSNALAFKVWKLVAALRVLGYVILGCLFFGFLAAAFLRPEMSLLTVRDVAVFVLASLATALVGKTVVGVVRLRDTLKRFAISLAMCLVGFLVARIHLWTFDRWYLRLGRARALDEEAEMEGVAQSAE